MSFGIDARHKLLLFVAAGLLALFVVDRLVLSAVMAGWRERQERIVLLRAQLQQGDNLLEQEARWLHWQAEVGQRLFSGNKSSAENEMLALVDDWARDAGLQVNSLRPLWKENKMKEPLLELQVTGTGGMLPISRFLYALETAHSAIAIEQLELLAQAQDGRDLTVKLRLSGLCRNNGTSQQRNSR